MYITFIQLSLIPLSMLNFFNRSKVLSNSYTMGCPPVRGDNPRILASGLSYIQVDKHGITILYPYISVDLARHEIVHTKVGKGGINAFSLYWLIMVELS